MSKLLHLISAYKSIHGLFVLGNLRNNWIDFDGTYIYNRIADSANIVLPYKLFKYLYKKIKNNFTEPPLSPKDIQNSLRPIFRPTKYTHLKKGRSIRFGGG